MRDFIQANDVAGMIGLLDGAAFLRRRARLERDHAFPRPLPTSDRPLIWKRAHVAAWMDAQGRAPLCDTPQITVPPHNVHLLESARSR